MVANQAARDRSQISRSGPKCFGEGAKGLCGHRSKRLVALARHGVARAQTLFALAQVTFGRLSVPRAKRPFAPPQGNFQSFVLIWPLSMALWFATKWGVWGGGQKVDVEKVNVPFRSPNRTGPFTKQLGNNFELDSASERHSLFGGFGAVRTEEANWITILVTMHAYPCACASIFKETTTSVDVAAETDLRRTTEESGAREQLSIPEMLAGHTVLLEVHMHEIIASEFEQKLKSEPKMCHK